MLKFYYNPAYKYTNRTIIDVSSDTSFRELDYENIDSPDTINGHLIYELAAGEKVPTYVVDTETGWKWFVSGITQLRTGKFQISLLRDLCSESLDWTTEDAYIEAGTASDFCRYKKWGLPFTNTKVGSQRLNFGGKSSFFVFYVNEQKDTGGVLSEDDFKVDYGLLPGSMSYDLDLNDLSEVPNFNFVNYSGNNAGTIRSWSNLAGSCNFKASGTDVMLQYDNLYIPSNDFYVYTEFNVSFSDKYLSTNMPAHYFIKSAGVYPTFSSCMQSFLSSYRSSLGTAQSQTAVNQLDAYVDKVIRVPDDNNPGQYLFYKITRERQVVNHYDLLTNAQTETFTTLLKNNIYNGTYTNVGTGHFYFRSIENLSTYTLEFIGADSASSFSFTFTASSKKLPKSAVRCVNLVSDEDVSDQMLMQTLMLAQANPGVDAEVGSAANIGRIIDVQYLPFSVATQKNADFVIGTESVVAETLDIDDFIYQTNLTTLTDINKETDSIYIVSPSRKSQFKFSPYNNDGLMEFSTKITIRPNQSVIYVRPTTQGLLMQDWDDKECLIIQEDFSLTKINSDWANYVYNNRNYQNAFNLQVQTKEFERGWERRVEQAQAASDEWNARNLSAQKAQTYTGNLPIISGIAGAIGTAWADEKYMAAAALDREYNEALYQKSMEVARTQFSYQIDNVKSQPLIPTTITVIDCKMLDGIYLEFYSTNATELNSIAKFYQYNGNRIENYGNFASYWGNFVRGKIIISQKYTQPEIDELNRRLELGIFTGGITL